jgi:hypothetical protein
MVFSNGPNRRNFLFNITAMLGAAASVVRSNRPAIAISDMIEIVDMDEANTLHIIPSRLYVPLSSQDLAEAREKLIKIKTSDEQR